MSPTLPDSWWLKSGILAGACLAAAMLGHLLPFAAAALVPFLSSPGIALFALLSYGLRLWPGVAAAALAVALIGGAPLPAAACIAAGSTLEALLGAHLLHKAGYSRKGGLRDVLILGLLATALPPVTAIPLNVLGLSLAGSLGISLPQAGLNWWANDTLSILLTTPLLLTLTAQRRADWTPARLGEAAALAVTLSLAATFTFGIGYQYFTKPFVLFPFLFWGILRFGMAGSTATSLLIAHAAAWGMAQGIGPFIADDTPTAWNHAALWAFIAIITASSMTLAAIVEGRRRAEASHAESEKNIHALLDAVAGIAFLIDVRGNILACNQVAAAWRGKRPEELIGGNLLELMPPDLRSRCQSRIDQVCGSGQPQRASDEMEGRRFEISLFPVKNGSGAVSRLAIHAADITAQERRESFNAILQEIDRRVLQHEKQDRLLQFICDRIVSLFDFEFGWIGHKEADGSIGILAHAGRSALYGPHLKQLGLRWDGPPASACPACQAMTQGQPVTLLSDGPLFAHHPCQRGCRLCATLAIPLRVRGEIFGCLTLDSCRLDAFEDAQLMHMLTEEAARRISVALEMAQDVQKLSLLGSALSSAANAVFITDHKGQICWANQAFQLLSGYAPKEILGKTPSILKSGRQDEAYYRSLWNTILSGKIWNNETVERHKNGHLYTVQQTITPICDDDGEISHFISIHEDITSQKEAAAELDRLAHYDLLTGLANRTLFYTRLRENLALARRNNFKVALLFIDLNRFKQVNDSVGHHTGDLLLKAAAQRLSESVRTTDTVARLGGDEFTVILPSVKSRQDAAQVAEKIIAALDRPFHIQEHRFEIGGSIGITLFPDDTDQEESLISYADMMMYEAKRHDESTYQFYPATS